MSNESKVKTIGVLTSGGDSPGMNAFVRSAVRTALYNGINVKGVRKGYSGLINNDFIDMELRSVSGILERGGTVLASARCLEFKEPAGIEKAKQNCISAGLDGLIICGGDGSFRGARDLSLAGIPCIGVPGTIDNDIASSAYSIGFDTAVNTVVQNIDKLRDTSASHDRCSVVEVMGRNCGDIALQAAICCGAVSVLIPEIPFDLERDVIAKMQNTLKSGKNHFIVIVAEGIMNKERNINTISQYIEARTGIITRSTVIGHVQRGGSPSARDRVLASRMGHYAVELLIQGIGNRVVVQRGGHIKDFDILEALSMKKELNLELIRMANEISI